MVFKEKFQRPEHLHLIRHAGWGLRLPLARCHPDGWKVSGNQALQVLQVLQVQMALTVPQVQMVTHGLTV